MVGVWEGAFWATSLKIVNVRPNGAMAAPWGLTLDVKVANPEPPSIPTPMSTDQIILLMQMKIHKS